MPVFGFIVKVFYLFVYPFDSVNSLKQKVMRIQKALRNEKKISVRCDSPRLSLVQAVLSRGDRRLSTILLSANALQGNWTRAFRENDFDPQAAACRERSIDEFLPWDVLDHGIDKERLWHHYQKALTSC